MTRYSGGRRRYRSGHRCQDCGWDKPTTVIRFWASGYLYRVCSRCIRPYYGVINYPEAYPTGVFCK